MEDIEVNFTFPEDFDFDLYAIKGDKGDTGDTGATGATGNGIVSVEKTSTDGLVDTYTITYTNGNTTTFNVSNGKGILSIAKTSTSELVDTYTITYNDGTTSTYEVTNGEDGEVTQEQLNKVQEQVDTNKTIFNALPKITDTGTNITLNDTANSPLEIKLKGNILQDGTPTPSNPVNINVVTGNNTINICGKNLLNENINEEATLSNYGNKNIVLDNSYTLETNTYTISLSAKADSDTSRNINKINLYNGDTLIQQISFSKATNTNWQRLSISFSVSSNITFNTIVIQVSNAGTYNFKEFQIEKGSTATEFTNYQGETYSINLGDIEYCQIGDYSDEFVKIDNVWKLNKKIVKTTITSNNVNDLVRNVTNLLSVPASLIYKNKLGAKLHTYDSKIALLNKYHEVIQSSNIDSGSFSTNLWDNDLLIFNENFTDLETAKSILIGTEIYIVQENPTLISLNNTLQEQLDNLYNKAISYNDQTNILQTNADLPFVIKATALKINDATVKEGIYIENGKYTHFTKFANNKYICREFKRVYINNLLQLYKMYVGNIVNNALTVVSDIGTSYSDVVGPVMVHRGEIDNWVAKWTGGTHGIEINGTEYPTATQTSLKVYVDNKLIENDGLYFGKVTIITENDLYIPQTITGNDLSTATKALKEQRTYTLTNMMNVKVKLMPYTQFYITTYYGCQCNSYDMKTAFLPNNMVEVNFDGLENPYYFENKENKYYLYNNTNGSHYDVELLPYGLGNYPLNDGSVQNAKFGNVATYKKIYFQLISTSSAYQTSTTEILGWEANYNYYFN